jgi:transposase InsO family protein
MKSNLSYFNKNLKTEIVVDASPVGLAAVLLQFDEKTPDNKHIVLYISRALTEQEKRYCLTEREALAVVWAIERLHYYIYGCEFILITDNSAVQLILNNYSERPKARISRWFVRLMPYKFKVIHKPGIENIADYFSRNPVEQPDKRQDDQSERVIAKIVMQQQNAINTEMLTKATEEDETSQELKLCIQGKVSFNSKKLQAFLTVRNELHINENGLIMREDRFVIPESLQQHVIKIAHEGHMGMIKTKQLLRAYVYFPGLDKKVDQFVKNCDQCMINTKQSSLEPFKPTVHPDEPWEQVDIDFYGPLTNGRYIMVLIDAYSGYPLATNIVSTSAEVVIPELDTIFATFGIPDRVKTDNGPPFNSNQFSEFAKSSNFKHHRITPYWPRANGACEKFMQGLKKILTDYKPSEIDSKLNGYLRNYRSTPHLATNKTPHSLVFKTSRTPTKLPKLTSNKNNFNSDHNQVKQNVEQNREKYRRYANNNMHTKSHKFKVNDLVLFLRFPKLKHQNYYEEEPYKVEEIHGSQVKIVNKYKSKTVNSSFLKLFKHFNESDSDKPALNDDNNSQKHSYNSQNSLDNNQKSFKNSEITQPKSSYNLRSRKSAIVNELNDSGSIFIPSNKFNFTPFVLQGSTLAPPIAINNLINGQNQTVLHPQPQPIPLQHVILPQQQLPAQPAVPNEPENQPQQQLIQQQQPEMNELDESVDSESINNLFSSSSSSNGTTFSSSSSSHSSSSHLSSASENVNNNSSNNSIPNVIDNTTFYSTNNTIFNNNTESSSSNKEENEEAYENEMDLNQFNNLNLYFSFNQVSNNNSNKNLNQTDNLDHEINEDILNLVQENLIANIGNEQNLEQEELVNLDENQAIINNNNNLNQEEINNEIQDNDSTGDLNLNISQNTSRDVSKISFNNSNAKLNIDFEQELEAISTTKSNNSSTAATTSNNKSNKTTTIDSKKTPIPSLSNLPTKPNVNKIKPNINNNNRNQQQQNKASTSKNKPKTPKR